MTGRLPARFVVPGVCFVVAMQCAQVVHAQQSAPAQDAPAQSTPAATPAATPAEAVAALDGTQLYLAQVLGQLGAEALVGSLALCPAVSWAALVAAPLAGVLAADWVGREMGLRTGSQIAAIAGNYVIGCTGITAIAGGALFTYLVVVFGILPLALVPGTATVVVVAVLAAAGVLMMVAGTIASLARPFLTPLLWSAFTAREQVHADDVPDARDRAGRGQSEGQP